MKKRHLTKAIALLSVASLSLTGCNSFISEDVASYPLAATMTSAELVDYYAKALEYDSVVSRNVNVHETRYEVRDIEGEKSELLKDLASQCEAILGLNEYKPTEESLKLVSNDTYNYIKGVIDNEVLSDGKVQNITGALGYYFVDIQYNISSKQPGTFKDAVNIVGLNGAFHKDYLGNYIVDEQYMSVIVNKLNEYYYSNGINKCATYDANASTIKVLNNTAPIVSNEYAEVNPAGEYNEQSDITDNIDNTDIVDESTEDSNDTTGDILNAPGDENEQDTDISDIETTETSEDSEISTEDTDNNSEEIEATEEVLPVTPVEEESVQNTASEIRESTTNYTIVTPDSRRLQLNTALINKIIGSSAGEAAMIPNLDMIYIKPGTEGTISGLGIYPAGDDGLKTFGFDRDELAGTITLRYVFKDDSEGSGDILGVNVYAIEEEITNGINMSSNNVLIPEFLQSEFEQIIERADRAIVNDDLAGMLSGNIFEDIGVGILRGYKDKNTGIQKYMSTIRQVINRDTANNSYLLEVETTTIEGAKDVDSYGTYKDISYVVVQQQGNKFIITDWCRVSRTMTNEPAIDPDSNVQKRLIALNLAGTISDDSKDDIKALLGNLYTAGTNRLLRGPKDIVVGGETKTLNKGMYDCFSSDASILSSDELEYENSTLRNVLVKHGTDIQAVYSGTVTEWIGGYEDQAEFTTEELVTYQGLNRGYYMQVYYLARIENDEWVIAERTVLDEYEITDAEKLASVQERVGQSSSK
jgi:hypothetical protein